MPEAISLRDDYSGDGLRQLARESDHANQTRRLLALAEIANGKSRSEAARVGSVQVQTVRDWVVAFNRQGPEGLINTPPPGRPSQLSPEQKQAIAKWVEVGPDPEVDGIVRWRRIDIKERIQQCYDVSLNLTSVGKLLKELGFSYVSARPQHRRQDPETIESFKKNGLP